MKKGWERKRLDAVLEIKNGKNQRAVISANGPYPIYGSGGVMGRASEFLCPAGCTVVGRKGSINNPIYVQEPFWIVDTAFGLAPKPSLEPKFLHYFCLSFDFSTRNKGTTIPSLVKSDLLQIGLPLPPLPEQRRIVGILDGAFAAIATAKAQTEKNLANAREVFDSHLNDVFTRRGEGWVEKRLGEIGTTQTGSTPKTSDQTNYGDFISFVKPGDFNADGSLDYDKAGLSERGAKGARKVPAGSVLMVCIGATIGKCGYCDQDVATNQQVNALTPSDGSSNRFIYYQMLTETFQRKVIQASGQATLPIINKSKWSALSIWVPPKVKEQKTISAKLDAFAADTQRLEALYRRKLESLEELKKSLLHRAFEGEL
ncbi:MAG TPA: restriction endonuclease subunit S [Kiritimatiellia bacterium]|nr:restriction endonuclease subunit S [Kiritimatiellia bacterium]